MTDLTSRYLADYQPAHFTINTIDLTFELNSQATIVTSVMSISKQGQHQQPLVLDGEQLKLLSVSVNDRQLSDDYYQLTASSLKIPCQDDEFTLTIITEVNPQENTSLEGLYKSGDAFCTQCEAEGFRKITYYLDRPDVMAVFTTKVIADKHQYKYLLSNGNKIDQGELANDRHFVQWHDPFPKPCYLFALVAGDFDRLQDKFTTSSGREVALEIFVDEGNLCQAKHAMTSLQKAMLWDEQTFGLEYDLDIYMIVAVDFFNMGAMENKGLNVFNSKYVLADADIATDTDYFNIEAVIGHEYFHNWTGNRVTCRDWFQLSLKEGLTVFRDQQFSADMHSAAVTRIKNVRVLRSHQFAEDAGPMSHPIRPEKVMEMNNFYTLTVYEKGAEVIRMLNTLLGRENFRKGMDLYFARFDGMAVTCDDFVNAMADASSIDLSQFKLWYSQAGTPSLQVSQRYDAQQQNFTLSITQRQPEGANAAALQMPLKIELLNPQDNSVQSHLLELNQHAQQWTFDAQQGEPVVAFLADFTAPVKVEFSQTDKQLTQIMEHAQDAFCRWDAGQKLVLGYIKKLTAAPDHSLPNSLLATFAAILKSGDDLAFKAEQLTLPSFAEVADLIEHVDPVALVNALDQVKAFLATGLAEQLLSTYHACQAPSERENTSDDKQQVAQRALKNVCLSYLAVLAPQQHLVAQQFAQSTNMTDTLAALSSAGSNNLEQFSAQMTSFEQKWQASTLVMDKWFSLHAQLGSEAIFERLDSLLRHPSFTLKNPNRARALISAFCANNMRYFHCQSGRGYQFLAQQVAALDGINAQVASRLITPLLGYASFDKNRQALMKTQLRQLNALPQLSKDLKEKLDAALN
jgi:aminopeptidase N